MISYSISYSCGSNTVMHAFNTEGRLIYCSHAKNARWTDLNGFPLEIGDCVHYEDDDRYKEDACGLPLMLILDWVA